MAKWVVGWDRVGEPAVRVVHVDAQDFAEVRAQILPMALWVLLRTGVAHRDVEEAVRAELSAAAAVVLRHTNDLQQPAGRSAGIGAEIRRGLSFDDDSRQRVRWRQSR